MHRAKPVCVWIQKHEPMILSTHQMQKWIFMTFTVSGACKAPPVDHGDVKQGCSCSCAIIITPLKTLGVDGGCSLRCGHSRGSLNNAALSRMRTWQPEEYGCIPRWLRIDTQHLRLIHCHI